MIFLCFSCSKSTQKTLLIANAKVDCTGVGPQQCLQVKEEGQTDWTFFYDPIEGFDYVEGFYYKIKVEVSEVADPPADGASLKYQLLEVVEKSTIPLNLDQGSWLVIQIKDQNHFGRNPFVKINLSKNEINGNTSCNRFSGNIDVTDNAVDISEISSTKMMCRDIDVEAAFLEALKEVSFYTLSNGKLQFLDENKELLMVCKYLKSE